MLKKFYQSLLMLAVLCTSLSAIASDTKWINDQYTIGQNIVVKPISISVIQENNIVGIITIGFNLFVINPDRLNYISQFIPQIRGKSLMMLRNYATSIDIAKPLPVDYLSTLLQDIVNKSFGSNQANILLIFAALRRL